MPSSMNWADGSNGGTPLSAANLNKLAVVADIGVAGTPTDNALRNGQMLLLSMPTSQLSANWTSAANTSEQVIANLLITLPVIARKCTIKIKIQFYSTFGTGNTNVYGAIGPTSSGLGNTRTANVYAGGATSQTVWTNTGILSNYDMSTQQYASMTVTNDASSLISFSANAFRTSLLVEIFG